MRAPHRSWRAWPALALLGGCAVGPAYHPPATSVTTHFAETPPAGITPDARADWWSDFGDQELDRLVAIALAESPDIQTAASRVRQARLGIAAARAQLLPEVDAMGNVTQLNLSKNAGVSSLASLFGGSGGSSGSSGSSSGGSSGGSANQGGITIPGGGITTYAIGFDASWELDIFGAKSALQSVHATAAAAEWSARDAALTLIAEIASQYLQLRVLQQRETVIRAEIAAQSRSLELQHHTVQAGLVPQGDYIRQRGQLTTLQATLDPVLADQRIQMHALAVLVGRDPAAMIAELAIARPLPAAPPPVPPGLPSELLRRRPDIRAAERQLAAATADIGIATAALYPRFNLTALPELISTSLGNLISPSSEQLTATGVVSFPLLDFGRARTQVRIKREQAEQAYQNYRKVVLGALRDVEDALARIRDEQDHNRVLQAGVNDATRSLAAIDARYRAGLSNYAPVLEAQGTVLQARDALVASDGALRTDIISLHKAIGGGWEALPPLPAKLPRDTPYTGK